MSSVTFNGQSTKDIIMITSYPVRPTWREVVDYESIPYRRNERRKPSGVWERQEASFIRGIAYNKDIEEIYSLFNGVGMLRLSTEPHRQYKVEVSDISFTPVSYSMSEVYIELSFFPFGRPLLDTVIPIMDYYTDVVNAGSVFSEPIIKFTPKVNDEPILKGDVNFDGKINASDASLVLSEYTNVATGGEKTFTPEQEEAADMNADGVIDSSDAGIILDIYSNNQAQTSNKPSEYVIINVNGEEFTIGLPPAVVTNGFEVTVDCEKKLLYYTNSEGEKINIMQYSYGDFPLLRAGLNHAKYTGNVAEMTVTVNERWL